MKCSRGGGFCSWTLFKRKRFCDEFSILGKCAEKIVPAEVGELFLAWKFDNNSIEVRICSVCIKKSSWGGFPVAAPEIISFICEKVKARRREDSSTQNAKRMISMTHCRKTSENTAFHHPLCLEESCVTTWQIMTKMWNILAQRGKERAHGLAVKKMLKEGFIFFEYYSPM